MSKLSIYFSPGPSPLLSLQDPAVGFNSEGKTDFPSCHSKRRLEFKHGEQKRVRIIRNQSFNQHSLTCYVRNIVLGSWINISRNAHVPIQTQQTLDFQFTMFFSSSSSSSSFFLVVMKTYFSGASLVGRGSHPVSLSIQSGPVLEHLWALSGPTTMIRIIHFYNSWRTLVTSKITLIKYRNACLHLILSNGL